MISAVIQKKSNRWFSVSSNNKIKLFEGVEKRIPREDEITSSIFGGMKYLDSNAVYNLFMTLCHEPLGNLHCENHHVQLWPRKRVKFKGNYCSVEPDAIFDFTMENGTKVRIILEIKWHDYKYGYEQLEKEWAAFGKDENTFLLYVATDISNFKKEKGRVSKFWRAASWENVENVLTHDISILKEEKTKLFFKDVAKMLGMFNKETFYGFNHIEFNDPVEYLNLNLIDFSCEYSVVDFNILFEGFFNDK
ncbi:hypothetical protein [Providencia rettgeri]|uniref:hypothetical protein n=1 Tax=Providencia rettgeri TaxID=587 RepID=UPI0023604C5E|nr:hypothetical protein [Providencia rettgeri]